MKRRIFSALRVFLLLCILAVTVCAAEVPDLERLGSIRIRMTHQGEAVGGGTLTLYQVARVHLENDADYSFHYVGDYESCGGSLKDFSAATAQALAAYATENQISGVTKRVGEDGRITFENLELGLYLLVQDTAAEGYNAAKPFLVSVPGSENDSFVYDVDASPKLELEQAPTEPSQPTEPSKPQDPTLPQTGQNQWPVPVLTMLGLCLIVLGGAFVAADKKKRS